jgi:hypothetical protein
VRSGKVTVVAACNQLCGLVATGTVSVPGSGATGRQAAGTSKVYRLARKSASLTSPGRATLSLSIPKAARKATQRALRRGKRVVATVTVRAEYVEGTATAKRKIRLKR